MNKELLQTVKAEILSLFKSHDLVSLFSGITQNHDYYQRHPSPFLTNALMKRGYNKPENVVLLTGNVTPHQIEIENSYVFSIDLQGTILPRKNFLVDATPFGTPDDEGIYFSQKSRVNLALKPQEYVLVIKG